MAVLISGTADSVSGQLQLWAVERLLWPLTFRIKRAGTFFAHIAAGNLYDYIRLGQKRPARILLFRTYLAVFSCIGNTNLGIAYDNLSSELLD
jgi:hypothetical protein